MTSIHRTRCMGKQNRWAKINITTVFLTVDHSRLKFQMIKLVRKGKEGNLRAQRFI